MVISVVRGGGEGGGCGSISSRYIVAGAVVWPGLYLASEFFCVCGACVIIGKKMIILQLK